MNKRSYLLICIVSICTAILTVIILKLLDVPEATIFGGGLAGAVAGALGALLVKKGRN